MVLEKPLGRVLKALQSGDLNDTVKDLETTQEEVSDPQGGLKLATNCKPRAGSPSSPDFSITGPTESFTAPQS